jgi:hypothetical protein
VPNKGGAAWWLLIPSFNKQATLNLHHAASQDNTQDEGKQRPKREQATGLLLAISRGKYLELQHCSLRQEKSLRNGVNELNTHTATGRSYVRGRLGRCIVVVTELLLWTLISICYCLQVVPTLRTYLHSQAIYRHVSVVDQFRDNNLMEMHGTNNCVKFICTCSKHNYENVFVR